MYRRPPSYYKRSYNPQNRGPVKKPIRSFRDLEVYQHALEAAVVIAKEICPSLSTQRSSMIISDSVVAIDVPEYPFSGDMLKLSLEIPRFIAEAHALRFDFPDESLKLLERARFGSNRMVVYLEQVRGIYAGRVDHATLEGVIGRYANNRIKLFRLAGAWQRNAPTPKPASAPPVKE